ncbi:hypothetical protein WG66_016837, partial [Moniliophthora roreri]
MNLADNEPSTTSSNQLFVTLRPSTLDNSNSRVTVGFRAIFRFQYFAYLVVAHYRPIVLQLP